MLVVIVNSIFCNNLPTKEYVSCFKDHFTVELGLPGCLLDFLPPLVPEDNLWGIVDIV